MEHMDRLAWIARKRAELAGIAHLDARQITPSIRDFGSALRMGRRDLIAIPTIRAAEARAAELAQLALDADCAVIAVATDAAEGGTLASMRAVSEVAGATPVLRVDLVLHESQIYETRLGGGDAALIDTSMPADLPRLAKTARSTRMTPVFWIENADELAAALAVDARFVLVSAARVGGEDLPAALALCARIPTSVAVCLHAPSVEHPDHVRALLGKVDGVLLPPAFPPEAWRDVAVLEQ